MASQYTPVAFAETLVLEGITASVGTIGGRLRERAGRDHDRVRRLHSQLNYSHSASTRPPTTLKSRLTPSKGERNGWGGSDRIRRPPPRLLSQRFPEFDRGLCDQIEVDQQRADVSGAGDRHYSRIGHRCGGSLGVGRPPVLVTKVAGDE